MNPRDLHGVAVVVTRPELQAGSLCRMLEARGAHVIRFPVIDIEATDYGASGHAIDPAAEFDWMIFTSSNAVRFGALRFSNARGFAAVGPVTAQALEYAGYSPVLTPETRFDSEGLLMHPRLRDVAGARILIVTGAAGRDHLRIQLAARGAHVQVAEVYQRTRLDRSATDLAQLQRELATQPLRAITATSVDIARALLDMATSPLREQLTRAHWVVPGARAAAALSAFGLAAPVTLAESAEDQSLVSAIVRWRSSVSGA